MRVSATQSADAVHWNLAELLDGAPGGDVDALLQRALERTSAFAQRYRGSLATLDGAELAEAMGELAEIHDLIGRVGSYAQLHFSTNTADPPRGALLARVEESSTALQTQLIFFELEWAALSDERVEELLAHDGLGFCRHHLRSARRYRTHLLSEPEERILSEKSISSRSAWTRLFEELTASIQVTLEGTVPLDVALARRASAGRSAGGRRSPCRRAAC